MAIGNLSLGRDMQRRTATQRDRLISLVEFINARVPVQQLVYKGGLFLGEYTHRPRFTQDVDVSVLDSGMYELLKGILREYGEALVEAGELSGFDVKDTIEEHMSGGAKFYGTKGQVLLSIDISLHRNDLDFMVMETSVVGTVQLTTVEQIVTDKLTVAFSRSRFRRAKDVYDLWLIISNCNISASKVARLLYLREIYPLPVDKAPFSEDCYEQMKHAYEKFILKDPFAEGELQKPDFIEVVSVVSKFMTQFMEDDT